MVVKGFHEHLFVGNRLRLLLLLLLLLSEHIFELAEVSGYIDYKEMRVSSLLPYI